MLTTTAVKYLSIFKQDGYQVMLAGLVIKEPPCAVQVHDTDW